MFFYGSNGTAYTRPSMVQNNKSILNPLGPSFPIKIENQNRLTTFSKQWKHTPENLTSECRPLYADKKLNRIVLQTLNINLTRPEMNDKIMQILQILGRNISEKNRKNKRIIYTISPLKCYNLTFLSSNRTYNKHCDQIRFTQYLWKAKKVLKKVLDI